MSTPKQNLIRYRLQRAHEALDDAQFNLDAGRFSVASNRIYYAMFYAVLALLTTRDLSSSRHSGVIALFYDNFVRTDVFPAALAKYVGRALEVRTGADYKCLRRQSQPSSASCSITPVSSCEKPKS